MNIECKNITAEYRPNLKGRLYNFIRCRTKQPANQTIYPLFNFSGTFVQGITLVLGPNSSGKSTLLKLLSGNMLPTMGTIRFDGQIAKPPELRRLISYLPQAFNLYPNFTACEMLSYIALLRGITPHSTRTVRVNQVLQQTGLSLAAQQKLKTYSRGMLQRVGIAQTLLDNTPILLLDEPTAGLDPAERTNFLNLLTKLSQNRLIIFASSNLSDIGCADTVFILHEGHCRFTGTPSGLALCAKRAVLTPMYKHTSFTRTLEQGYQAVISQVNAK